MALPRTIIVGTLVASSLALAITAGGKAIAYADAAKFDRIADKNVHMEQAREQLLTTVLDAAEDVAQPPAERATDMALGQALISLLGETDIADRHLVGAAARAHLASAIYQHPNRSRLWRSYLVAQLFASGPTVDLDHVSRAAMQLDGGNAFTAMTLVELALRYPQSFEAGTRSDILRQLPKLAEYAQTRRPLGRLYASLNQEGRDAMLGSASNPDQLKAFAREFLQ